MDNYFDVANAVWLGYEPVAELEVLSAAGALTQMHVKELEESSRDRPPAELWRSATGRLASLERPSYPDVAAALRRLSYDGYLVFETDAVSVVHYGFRHWAEVPAHIRSNFILTK